MRDRRPRLRPRLPGLTRLEVAPPAWLIRAVALKPAAVPWPETVQAVLAVSVPLAVGAAVGQLSLSSFLGMGGLTVAMTNARGPLPWKLRRSGVALAAGVAGLLAGLVTGAHPVTAVGAVLLLSFVAAVVSVVGAVASVAALQLLVYAAIGGSLAGRVPLAAPPLAMLAGGLWALLCTVVVGLVAGYRRVERESLALVFQRVAELLAATGTPWMEQARRALTGALNDAFDSLLGVRARTGGRDWPVLRLAALLNATTPLVEATVAIAHSGEQPPPALHQAAVALAGAVRAQGPPPSIDLDPASEPLLQAWRRAHSGVRSHWDRATIPPRPPSLEERLRSATDQVLAGRGTWLFVVRLVLCMTIAAILERVLPIAHSYWIVMTVALVLKPDFGSVFVRGLQRGLGTVVG
ncbi:MAG: FUSC family protein, partial [Candidatus Dormibacteraeota bacterium]|nr:FUSC family protein [Candidatus Dormibacteraeota bacterium]